MGAMQRASSFLSGYPFPAAEDQKQTESPLSDSQFFLLVELIGSEEKSEKKSGVAYQIGKIRYLRVLRIA